MHIFSILLIVPTVLGCLNVNSNSCASFIKSQSATASPFCNTFTQSVVTATTGLPAWATYCSSKPSLISAECSCAYTAGSVVTTAVTTLITTTAPTSGPGTTAPPAAGIVTPTKVTTVFPSATGETMLASATVISGVFDGKMARWHRTCKLAEMQSGSTN